MVVEITRISPEGRYLVNTYCSTDCLQFENADYIFKGRGDLLTQYHDFTTGLPVDMPPKPSEDCKFNYTTKQWEDPRSLQDFKAAQWNQIKEARAKAEYSGFVWDGSTFDSDAVSQNHITGAVTLAAISSTFTLDWILADNSTRTLNQLEMLQVGAALGNHVAEQFSKGIAYRTAVDAATSKEEVEAISWK